MCDPEIEIVGVEESCPVRVVEPHSALERAVEAEVARVRVVRDDHPVIPRVPGGADGELLSERTDRGRVERAWCPLHSLAVERRPVLARDARDLALLLGRERECERDGRGEPAGERRARPARGARRSRRRARRRQVWRPRLRGPARSRGRARARTPSRRCRRCFPPSRSRTADRRSGPGARACWPRAGRQSATRTRARRSTARRGSPRRATGRAGAWSQPTIQPSTSSSITGTSATRTAPRARTQTRRYALGIRSAATPPAQ